MKWAAGGGTSYTLAPVNVATTASITQSGTQTIDGVAVTAGMRVLCKDQSTTTQNGIWIVSASAWSRATDFNTGSTTLAGGVLIPVYAGTRHGGQTFQCTNNTAITIGTTAPTFTPVGAVSVYGLAGATQAIASAASAISIGNGSTAKVTNAIAIGTSANAANTSLTGQIAIGASAYADSGGIAIGASATNGSAANSYSIAIGNAAKNNGTNQFAQVAIGYGAQAEFIGQVSLGNGYFSAQGDHSLSFAKYWTTTGTGSPIEIGNSGAAAGANAPTNRISLVNDSTYLFDCDVVARNTATDTESGVWNLKFGIRRGAAAANTALIGTPVLTTYGLDSTASGWTVSVTADTTNGRPAITVTGEAGKTIYWLVAMRISKVTG